MADIDLTPFCEKPDGYREYLKRPFSRAGFTWATDGRILVRVPLRADVEENPKAPHAEKIIPDFAGVEFAPLPAVKWPKMPERDDCVACQGRGHECPDCTCECVECDGMGKHMAAASVTVRGVLFNVDYIRLIMSLPGLEFTTKPKGYASSPFHFDGGIGVLMYMRGESRYCHLGDIERLV